MIIMAEIKSTMDIIMEKAKGLTMSEGEKELFRKKELEKKIRVLVQKFLNGSIRSEKLLDGFNEIKVDFEDVARGFLIEECMSRIAPYSDNESLLDILDSIAQIDIVPIREILNNFESDLKSKSEEFSSALADTLKRKGVSGSAVIPNLAKDRGWKKCVGEVEEAFRKRLNDILYTVK